MSAPAAGNELARLRAALRAARFDLQRETRRAARAEAERDALLQSLSWRITGPLRRASGALRRRGLRLPDDATSTLAHDPAQYARWVAACDTLTPADRAAIGAHIGRFAQRPLISVVLPVYETAPALLEAAIASVRAQLYPDWELCIADDASPSPHVVAALEAAAATEPRLRWVRRAANGNISAASNSALELARGEFVALLDHDDILPETALYEVVAALQTAPETDILFSDEDHMVETAGGTARQHPYFKSGFDPEIMLGQNAISHLGVYRRDLLRRIGGFRLGFEGSQDHDLALRAMAATRPERIRHIPAILYHWRQRGDASFSDTQLARCIDAARRAIAEHVAGLPGGAGAEVAGNPWHRAMHRVVWPLPEPEPLVSLLLPAAAAPALLETCLSGVLEGTDYRALEVLLLHPADRPPVLPPRLAEDPRLRPLALPPGTPPAAAFNAGAAAATGEVLVLLAEDAAPVEAGWLEELVTQALRPDIGTVGLRLIDGEERLRHAGFMLHPAGVASLGRGAAGSDPGYGAELILARSVAANSFVGLALRRALFEAAGGLDAAALPQSGFDLDLGLRLGAAGQRNLWTPFAELRRLGEAAPEDWLDPDALARLRARWPQAFAADPAANANLDRSDGTPRLPIPGRRRAPWREA